MRIAMQRIVLIFISVAAVLSSSMAQFVSDPYEIILRTDRIVLSENISDLENQTLYDEEELVNGNFYRFIQFEELPNRAIKTELKSKGIKLLEYIPNKTYVASIPHSVSYVDMQRWNVRGLHKIQATWKQGEKVLVRNFDDYAVVKDRVRMNLSYYEDVPQEEMLAHLRSSGIIIHFLSEFNHMIDISVAPSQIDALLESPYVFYIEQRSPPAVPDDNGGRGLHRNSIIDSEYPMGRHYNGDGVNIMVRDDGPVGPHIDFKGRLNDEGANSTGTHGDGVAGVASAAGNLNPVNHGGATGAFIYVRDYGVSLEADNEVLDLHLTDDMMIANASYSDGCNFGYTARTKIIDQQIFENPSLFHTYSAGNSNNNDCDYGAGNQWGNITGGHKQGKNVIATANLDVDGELVASSSRGPAHDGRIKPDIAAHGAGQISTDPDNEYQSFGGTSAAAPCIMGVSAQLYQAYKELNGGEVPESALIKASMLNTANDLQNKGPDYRTGWGVVNAYRAVLSLEDQRYLSDVVDQGGEKTHTLEVPANTKLVKIMLYWSDVDAAVNTDKALVNDLNLEVRTAAMDTILPWILDPTPNAGALAAPATRGVDNLNNMEQVYIEAPEEGTLEINVAGFEIPLDEAKYYLHYEIVSTDDITMVYPSGGQSFVPGETERIHWDAIGDESQFLIEYSLDNGQSWEMIGTYQGDERLAEWNVPSAMTGMAQIRISRDGIMDETDANFSIGPVPQDLAFEEICYDQTILTWTEVENATAYEVYRLEEKYMEPVAMTVETSIVIPTLDFDEEQWYAVKALGDEDFVGRRTIAIGHTPEDIECVRDNDISVDNFITPVEGVNFLCPEGPQDVVITISNNGMVDITDFNLSYSIDGGAPVTQQFAGVFEAESESMFVFDQQLNGLSNNQTYNIEAWIEGALDTIPQNDRRSLNFSFEDIGQLPIMEDFEQNFPPDNWSILNVDESGTFEHEEVDTGSDGMSTFTAYINNYGYSTDGELDKVVTPLLSLENAETPVLTFDYAYTAFSTTFSDTLQIDIYNNCGLDFHSTVFYAGGLDLSTTGGFVTAPFEPTSVDQWKNELIDLTEFAGDEIRIEFININGFGNNLYLDNINIINDTNPPVAGIDADELTCVDDEINISSSSAGFNNNYLWDFGTDANVVSGTAEGPYVVSYSTSGTKIIQLTVINANGEDMVTHEVLVKEKPIPSFDADVNNSLVTFSNTSMFADNYLWEFGDGETSVAENPQHSYLNVNAYSVTLTAFSENCTEQIFEDLVDVTVSVDDQINAQEVKIIPNPNKGVFSLELSGFDHDEANIEILDISGRLIQKWNRNINSVNNLVFDLNVDSGVYLLKINSGDASITKRMIIQ